MEPLEDSSLRTRLPAVRVATNGGSRSRPSSEGAWDGAVEADNAYQFSSGLFCEEVSVGMPRVGTHASSSAMSAARRPNPNSLK